MKYTISTGVTGQTWKMVLRNSDDQFYNTGTDAFENFNSSNWTGGSYFTNMTASTKSGEYRANVPVGALIDGTLAEAHLGSSPALTSVPTYGPDPLFATVSSDGQSAIADAMLDRTDGVETGITPRIWLKRAAAALFGLTTNGQTKFRDQADSLDRISSTIDSNGDRTVLTFNDT